APAVPCARGTLPRVRGASRRGFADALAGGRAVAPSGALTPRAVPSRGLRGREAASWAVAAVAVSLAAYLGLRVSHPVPDSPTAEFEVEMPADVDIAVSGGSAASIAVSR